MFMHLVKFKSQPEPVMMGGSHISHGEKLATMADVEWVSPAISPTGAAIGPCAYPSLRSESVIHSYKPEDRPRHVCRATSLLTPEIMTKVKEAISLHQKILAVKEVRLATNWSLLDAKLFVEFLMNSTNWEPPF